MRILRLLIIVSGYWSRSHAYRQMALKRCEAYDMFVDEMGARKSLFSYFMSMKRSFSSWLELGTGFLPAGSLASHTELATRFPSAVMTER